MRISQIVQFITDRCGENTPSYVIREINYVISRTWYTTDLPGSLFEMVILPPHERIMILPWYVEKLKGARRYSGGEITLYTPRAAYQDNSWHQEYLSWTILTDTPRLVPYTNIGRLTLRAKKKAIKPYVVTIVGPGEFGGRSIHSIEFSVGDIEHETPEVVRDLTSLSKDVVTEADLDVLDIVGNLIAILPAERLEVYNKQIRIADACNLACSDQPCNRIQILFKTTAPVFTSVEESIPDATGQIIQNLVAAEILSKSQKAEDARRMAHHGKVGTDLLNEAQIRENEGVSMPVKLTRDAYTHEFGGYL